MKNFLRLTALAICAILMTANASAQDNYNATTMGEIVRYYETAKWAQGSPFNNQCWTNATQQTHAKTGCVPTAFAIIMRHHGFPAEGIGTLYNQQTGEVFTDRTYDYSKMPLTGASGWTTEQQNEVAKLMAHLGHAFGVTFGQGATSVSIGNTISERMQKFFNYNYAPVSNQYAGSGQMYDFEEWKKNLKNSLDNGCPVPYAADNKKDGTNDTRHMFVVDGYTENEYFHFNFGWGGGSNGWYKLDDITPTGDDYSWRTTSDGYDSKHQAFFNLMPNTTTYAVTATVNDSNMGTVSINNGTAGSTATANLMQGVTATLTAHPAQGYALASWTKNGVVVGSRTTLEVKVGTDANDYVANFDDEANVLVVKEYTVNPANGSLSGGTSKYSTWTSTDTQPALTLKATNASGAAVYAISALSSSYKAYATAYDSSDKAHTNTTYTLSVPEGYVITNYLMTYNVGTAGQISLNGELLNATGDHTLSAAPNAQTASFTLSVPSAGQQYITVKSIAVTVQSEGGGSTPTPDPEPEPDPTPTTYNITAEASPQNAGKVAINGGTQSTVANIDATSSSTVSLQAYPNSGYEFAGWYNGTTKVSSDNPYSITATAAISYIASFQEVQQGGSSSTNLAGKYFRLKTTVNSAVKYMNVGTQSDNSHGNVNMVNLNESSDDQIFLFEQSGDGYKLKANSGYYIKCAEWNVNANTTNANEASVLLFEESGDGYLINWYNTFKGAIKYFNIQTANAGDRALHPYSDGDKNGAAVWVLEEVIPSNEKTLNVTYSGATWNNEASSWWEYIVTNQIPAVTVKAANSAKAIGYSTVSGVRHPYLLDGNSFTISLPANCKIVGYTLRYKGHNLNTKTFTYTGNNGTTATETVGQDGVEKTLTVTGLENNEIAISVSDQSSQAGVVIVALEITYIENEFEPLPFKAEIENWRNDNPNTHLGTITIGGTAMKLTPEHLNASELTMPVVEGTTLAFTRKYRGFDFNGFYIGSTSLGENTTLTADNVAAIDENNPLIAKFTATDDVTLFYDDDEFSYRIPAIAKTGNGMLVAVSDYRHNLDDIGRDNHGTGTMRIDLVMRTSTDNGATWSETKTIAAGDNSKTGSYLRAFGDAAIAAVGQNIVVMAAAGDVVYTDGTTSSPNKMARIYSTDNGATWTIEEMTTKMYSQSTSLIPSGGSAFFGSGKLAVDPNFNGTGNARIYGALLVRIGTDGYNNFGVFSDDLGATWKILGGDNTNPVAKGDEPKVEILPNGQILLSARRSGGRVFRVFTYGDDKANGAGSWGDEAVNGCDNGGSNATNGEIICLDAKRPNGKPTKILLQSQPKGGSGQYDRKDVTIWYKEVSADETYTSATIASGWTMGKQVSTVQSSYSAMALQANGEIALFFEEAPCYADNYTKGYSMVYVPLTIEEITGENFLNPNAVVETVTVDVTLTDEQGNTYTHQFDYLPGDAAAINAALMTAYPFITELGEGNLQGSDTYYTYTNTVTLPFKVSNANTTVWHNIYWPANTAENDYPIYLSASAANDTYVPKVTESKAYGESTYNTLQNGDKISWAIYSVDNTLTFKFKNKLTGKYIQATSVATGNAQNVVYANENNATAFELLPDSYSYAGDYALVAKVGETTGYLCSTSATSYHYATHYNGSSTNRHEGAWIKFVEAPDYQAIINALTENIAKFGTGEGNYTDNNDIDAIKAIIENIGTTPLNTLNTHTETVQTVKESYREVVLTVNDDETETVPGSVSITVNGSEAETVNNKFVPANATVSILATANPGYRFVNWTRPSAQASAAARTAEARNSNVVSDQNPYTVTVSEALSLEANFEQIVVNATLTDAQDNTYNVTLNGLTSEVNAETLAAKLKTEYPFIEELGIEPKLTNDGASYTYTNTVKLKFKVSNPASDETDNLWHNIYYPTNASARPNYLSASTAETTLVEKVNDGTYNYGANPTYNTMGGNPKIAWAIYNVNNSFEFIFKNELTGRYIKVTSIASSDAQNVEFVEKAEATTFTFLGDAGTYNGDYALVAKVGEETGYLCSSSSSYGYATHHYSNTHQGAWMKIKEADYTDFIRALDERLLRFDTGNDKYLVTDEFQIMIDSLVYNKEQIRLNQFNTYFDTIDKAVKTWPKISLTITPENKGTTNIGGEENVVRKYVPTGDLTIEAVPVEGYHFVKWIDGTNEVETAAYTKNISGGKDDVIALTAEFAINIYNINVTADEGGNASASAPTVEHGSEVTLTATPSTGYSFAGWYDGENLISAEASYTFTVTSHINYTARFNEVPTGTVAIHITVASTDGTPVTNNATGNVKAIINNIGQGWATEADFVVGADVELVASSDYDQKAYLFDGWYKNDVLVSKDLEITVKATEAATYQARFFRGCVVIGEPKSNRMGYVTKITLEDGTSLGYDASNRAVVKAGTTVKINTWMADGYEAMWTNANGEIVGTDKDLVVEINEDVTYTANFEPVSYELTVRANDDSYGTVTAESGTSSGTTIKVGHNMEATITATANTGYYFVNWTKGTEVVSTNATYTIKGISEYDDMVDVEYIANFLPVENAVAGVYYRIGYDGFTAAASAGAARAAGDTYTYTLTPLNIGMTSGSITSSFEYTGTNPVALSMTATNSNGATANTIGRQSNAMFKLYARYQNVSTFKYSLSAPDGYKITGYNFTYKDGKGTNTIVCNDDNQVTGPGTDGYYVLSVTPNSQTAEFTLQASSADNEVYLYVKEFTVTIQEVGSGSEGEGSDEGEGSGETPETPSNRYYIQSVACGVSGGNNLQNALKMTQETLAASIFYYADSKLLSYDKGLYIIENGGTRGLQEVGVSGTVTITTSGETATISAPNYMHANTNGTTYYADHCGSNPDNHAANHNFVLEEVTTLPVTISSALHATFYAPVAVEIPEGVKAYVLKAEDIPGIETYAWMTSLKNGIIPANTGVIIKGAEGTYYFDIVDNSVENYDAARAEAVGNVLDGTVAKTKITEDAYILANREGKVGLYPVAKNSYLNGTTTPTTVRFTNNSHKAYLPVTNDWFGELLKKGTGFRFIYDDEEATDIEDVKGENGEVKTIYDLQGRKLSEITEPGIYIVGGKKVWVK